MENLIKNLVEEPEMVVFQEPEANPVENDGVGQDFYQHMINVFAYLDNRHNLIATTLEENKNKL